MAKLDADLIRPQFPGVPNTTFNSYLPRIVSALRQKELNDRRMTAMALATIRVETAGFKPIDEYVSKYNTSQGGRPFDLYEPGTAIGKRLGNTTQGDGARFKGRGFIQLTGRDNYTRIGRLIGEDLVGMTAMANDSIVAARILAEFLKQSEDRIRTALDADDLKAARRAVNGGSHGLEIFSATYRALLPKLDEPAC